MLLSAISLLQAQSLTWLGTLGGNQSSARDVSDNGAVVVGVSTTTQGQRRAFRWVANSGMTSLGVLSQFTHSEGYSVSADGNRVVGVSIYEVPYGGTRRAFLWVSGVGMRDLGQLPGAPENAAQAISGDGATVVGWAATYGLDIHAFRWTQATGMQDMGTLGGQESRARGVSRNGSVIAGRAPNHLGEMYAFWWTASAGMQPLYPLAVCCGEANGVSDNGQVIVGRAHSAQTERWHACLWWWNVSDYSPRDLGTLGGNESEAYACTDNQTAVGWSHNAAGQRRAFRWTPSGGMEDLSLAYTRHLTSGSYLEIAYGVSPDGRYIVGEGYNAARGRTEAFLLDTRCTAHNGDVDRNGCVDDADLLAVLFAFGVTGQNLGRVDVNCDGVIDDADLLQVLFNFGSGC
jgi:probable HAF family extracellular repeat protein